MSSKENKTVEIIPAIMPNSAEHLDELAQEVTSFAKSMHIDVMDGRLVPPMSWPYGTGQIRALEQTKIIPSSTQLMIGAHLMIESPQKLGVTLAERGIKMVLGQIEAMGDVEEIKSTLKSWKYAGAKEVGVSLLLDTTLSEIVPIIEYLDFVQIMSIAKIGYQGNSFEEVAIVKIEQLRKMYPDLVILVDGGVSSKNAGALARAGASKLVVGSAIMKQKDKRTAHNTINQAVERPS